MTCILAHTGKRPDRRTLLLFACCVLITGAAAFAQQQDDPHAPGGATDVYLNDSFEAADDLATAGAHAERGAWQAAAELLQRTANAHRGKLVRIGDDRYVDIDYHTQRVIAAWPQEGVQAYQQLYNDAFDEALAALGDTTRIQPLLALFQRFFCTSGAAPLADRIGALAIESGDYDVALHAYRTVCNEHPDQDTYKAHYQAMCALVHAMRGTALPDGTQVDWSTEIRWMGKQRRASDIRDLIERTFTATQSAPSGDWPIFGGNATRLRTATTSVDELGLLWRTTPFQTTRATDDNKQPDMFFDGLDLGMFPVVSGTTVYIQRMRDIAALNIETAETVWRYRPRGDEPTSTDDLLADSAAGFNAVTISGSRLFAALPGDSEPYYGYDLTHRISAVVCLDAATGRLLWETNAGETSDELEGITFDSSPIVAGGAVQVVGRRRRSFGFEDCYLYRFHTTNGQYLSRTHLGSASTGRFGVRVRTTSIAAYADGLVYIATDLGTIAAVSAHTGTVRWLRLYDRNGMKLQQDSAWSSRSTPTWALDPLMCADDRIIYQPRDATDLLVLSASDGRRLHTISRSQLGHARSVLGVTGNLVFCAGEHICCFDLTSQTLRWSADMPDARPLLGRGVLLDDRLLVPSISGISSFRIGDGTRTDVPWDVDGTAGNLLALPDRLIVASKDRITTYVRRGEILETLAKRMKAAPNDPGPALDFADFSLRGGEIDEALSALDQAWHRADAQRKPASPKIRARLHKTVMAVTSALRSADKLTKEQATKLAHHAARFAPDPEANLAFRLTFAAIHAALDQPKEAARLYQQILQDRTLRNLPVDEGDQLATRAAIHVTRRLDELIQQAGRSVYESFDKQADQLLETGRATRNTTMLERITTTYPNSLAAGPALTLIGDIRVSQGQWHKAADAYIQAYKRYPDLVDRPRLIERIAMTYESTGDVGRAYQWLTRGARAYPNARFTHNGVDVSFATYRNRFPEWNTHVEPARPAIAPPLVAGDDIKLNEGARLLKPRFIDEPHARFTSAVVIGPDGLTTYDPSEGTPQWDKPVPASPATQLLTETDTQLVLATGQSVFSHYSNTGAHAWSIGQPETTDVTPLDDWEDSPLLRTHALSGNRLVSAWDDGRIQCTQLTTGANLWTQTSAEAPSGAMCVGDRHVAYPLMRNGFVVLIIRDAATGDMLGEINTAQRRSVDSLMITLDEQLIAVTSQSVVCVDLAQRMCTWQRTFEGYIRPGTLVLDVDGLCLSYDGRTMTKIDLRAGHTLWQTDRLARRREELSRADLRGDSIIFSTSATVCGIDATTGVTQWRGTTKEDPLMAYRMLAKDYLLAIDTTPVHWSDTTQKSTAQAYLYDLRHSSGVIPKDGGAFPLGPLDDIRELHLLDNAFVLQNGSMLKVWKMP